MLQRTKGLGATVNRVDATGLGVLLYICGRQPNRGKVPRTEALVSFFENYSDEGGGTFLSKDEKQILIDEAVPFSIVSIERDAGDKYGERNLLTIELEGEQRKVGFSREKAYSRNRMIDAMAEHLAAGGDPVVARIELEGKFQVLVDAS